MNILNDKINGNRKRYINVAIVLTSLIILAICVFVLYNNLYQPSTTNNYIDHVKSIIPNSQHVSTVKVDDNGTIEHTFTNGDFEFNVRQVGYDLENNENWFSLINYECALYVYKQNEILNIFESAGFTFIDDDTELDLYDAQVPYVFIDAKDQNGNLNSLLDIQVTISKYSHLVAFYDCVDQIMQLISPYAFCRNDDTVDSFLQFDIDYYETFEHNGNQTRNLALWILPFVAGDNTVIKEKSNTDEFVKLLLSEKIIFDEDYVFDND